MVPLTPSGKIARRLASGRPMRAEAEALIKPNSRLTSAERLEIYSRSYWYRLLDSFGEDFPGLCAVLGQRAFNRLAETYLAEVPSRSFTLRDLGSRLEPWLREHPALAGKHPELALDMVRLEWAHIEAYDGEHRNPLGPADLAEIGPDLRFGLQPHITLLALSYPVDDLRIRVEELSAEKGGASNTIVRRRERAAVLRCKALDPAPTFLAVHRVDYAVYYKRLAEDEFRLLASLSRGMSLGESLSEICARSSAPEALNASVELWFRTWARLGWLCQPEEAS
ncbi:MAG TPA: DNA-binding domain-containing protein [Candidatus Acidoferrum sp.]|nr:DNA-binding domain-containing protein [Candidatus Acidoferrum sp.]